MESSQLITVKRIMEHLDLSQWTRYTKKKKYSFQSHNDLLFRIEKKELSH